MVPVPTDESDGPSQEGVEVAAAGVDVGLQPGAGPSFGHAAVEDPLPDHDLQDRRAQSGRRPGGDKLPRHTQSRRAKGCFPNGVGGAMGFSGAVRPRESTGWVF